MTDDKEIRFTEKKVDESWKDQIIREKEKFAPQTQQAPAANPSAASAAGPSKSKTPTSKSFVNLISSLGYQVMMHLGELPDAAPEEVSLPAAKEIIELLIALKQKTEGNLSPEEAKILEQLIPELQLKFAQKAQ